MSEGWKKSKENDESGDEGACSPEKVAEPNLEMSKSQESDSGVSKDETFGFDQLVAIFNRDGKPPKVPLYGPWRDKREAGPSRDSVPVFHDRQGWGYVEDDKGWTKSKDNDESGDEGACSPEKVAEPNLEMSKSQESDSGVSKDETCGFDQLVAIFNRDGKPPKVPLYGPWRDKREAGPSRDSVPVFHDRQGWGYVEDDKGWTKSKDNDESGDEGACSPEKVAEPNLEISKSQESDSGVSKDETCGFDQLVAIFNRDGKPPKVPLYGPWRDKREAGPSRDSVPVFHDRQGWGYVEDDKGWTKSKDNDESGDEGACSPEKVAEPNLEMSKSQESDSGVSKDETCGFDQLVAIFNRDGKPPKVPLYGPWRDKREAGPSRNSVPVFHDRKGWGYVEDDKGWTKSKDNDESGDEGACSPEKVAEPNLEMSKSQESDSGVSKDETCGFDQLVAIFNRDGKPPKVPLYGPWRDKREAGPSRNSVPVFHDRKGWGYVEDDKGWTKSKDNDESGDEGACSPEKVAEPNLEMSKSQESDSGVSKDETCGFDQLVAIFNRDGKPPKVPLYGPWRDKREAGPSRDSVPVFHDRQGWGYVEDDGAWGAGEDAGSIAEKEKDSEISKYAVEDIDEEDEDITTPSNINISWTDSKRLVKIDNLVSSSKCLQKLAQEVEEQAQIEIEMIKTKQADETVLSEKKQKLEEEEEAACASPDATKNAAVAETQIQKDLRLLKCYCNKAGRLINKIELTKRQIVAIDTLFKAIFPLDIKDIRSKIRLAHPALNIFQVWRLRQETSLKTLKKTQTLLEIIKSVTGNKGATAEFQRSLEKCEVFVKEEFDTESNEDRLRLLVEKSPGKPANIWFREQMARYREQHTVLLEQLKEIHIQYELTVSTWLDKRVAHTLTLQELAHYFLQQLKKNLP